MVRSCGYDVTLKYLVSDSRLMRFAAQQLQEEVDRLASTVNSEGYRAKVNALKPAFTFRRP